MSDTLSRTSHSRRVGAEPPSGGGLPGAIASEWTKLWSVRSVWWCLLASALLMAATAGQLAIYVANGNTDDDPTNDRGVLPVGRIAIDAVELTQFAVIALALLVITSEYGNGTIRASLTWIPSRARLLLAKTTVVAGVTFGAGLLLGGLGASVAAPVLGEWGRFGLGETVGDAAGLAGYLALISVCTVGLGAALRGAVGTLVSVFLLLAIVPTMLRLPDIGVLNAVADALPGSAGLHFLRGDSDPYPAAVGLLIVAGWAVAALLAGLAVLRHRDA